MKKVFAMNENQNSKNIMQSVARIAAAYVIKNDVGYNDLPELLLKTYEALMQSHSASSSGVSMPKRAPAVPVDQSVFDDYIVCLEDGKQLQMLKRHLKSVYGLTVEAYKERWGLPMGYPVVAPSYAKRRSAIAKTIGLGRSGRKGRRMKILHGSETALGQEQIAVVTSKS